MVKNYPPRVPPGKMDPRRIPRLQAASPAPPAPLAPPPLRVRAATKQDALDAVGGARGFISLVEPPAAGGSRAFVAYFETQGDRDRAEAALAETIKN